MFVWRTPTRAGHWGRVEADDPFARIDRTRPRYPRCYSCAKAPPGAPTIEQLQSVDHGLGRILHRTIARSAWRMTDCVSGASHKPRRRRLCKHFSSGSAL